MMSSEVGNYKILRAVLCLLPLLPPPLQRKTTQIYIRVILFHFDITVFLLRYFLEPIIDNVFMQFRRHLDILL